MLDMMSGATIFAKIY